MPDEPHSVTPDPGGPPPGRPVGQRALDLLVFAPVGAVVTAVEDLPELAAKGRARVEGQVRNARVIGQLVVTLGQRDIARRLARAGPPPPPAPAASTHEDRGATADVTPIRRPVADPAAPPVPPPPTPPLPTTLTAPTPLTTAAPGRPPVNGMAGGGPGDPLYPLVDDAASPASAAGVAGVAGVVGPADAAIPGYDTLSASQVVRRLDGLGATELEVIGRHESATRGRRTILHRVQQLLGTEDRPGAATDSD